MKKEHSSRSAFINFRVLLAFTLCLAGLSLAVTAFGAWPDLSAAAWVSSQNQIVRDAKARINNRKPIAASLKKKVAARGGASKSISGGASNAPGAPAQTSPASSDPR